MSYFIKLGRPFNFLLFWLLASVFYIIRYSFSKGHDYFIVGAYSVILVTIVLPQLVKYAWLYLSKSAALTVNEVFIFDSFENIKYYWDDIEEINPTDEALFIKLYEPSKYLNRIGNPFARYRRKIMHKLFKGKSYVVRVDMIAIEKGRYQEFLNVLNDFSILASQTSANKNV